MEAILQRAHKFVKVRLITPYSAATHWTPSGLQHNMIQSLFKWLLLLETDEKLLQMQVLIHTLL